MNKKIYYLQEALKRNCRSTY